MIPRSLAIQQVQHWLQLREECLDYAPRDAWGAPEPEGVGEAITHRCTIAACLVAAVSAERLAQRLVADYGFVPGVPIERSTDSRRETVDFRQRVPGVTLAGQGGASGVDGGC